MSDVRSSLILALDVPDRLTALRAVRLLSGRVGTFKLGLEIFVREGPQLVEEIRSLGELVFLDLKLHDIPNTVAGAVRSACRLGIQMLTVHTAGGLAMLRAAREAAESSSTFPLLLGVTALTSLSQAEIARLGIRLPLSAWVERLADVAREAGLSGLVASPLELSDLRMKMGSEIKLVVPGIRPSGTVSHDQSRTARPGEAIRAGADYIVVGRPILQAGDPVEAADRVLEEIRRARESPKGD